MVDTRRKELLSLVKDEEVRSAYLRLIELFSATFSLEQHPVLKVFDLGFCKTCLSESRGKTTTFVLSPCLGCLRIVDGYEFFY